MASNASGWGKSSQEYPVNAGVLQESILGDTLFLLYINDLPDDVICDIAICADDTTLYSKWCYKDIYISSLFPHTARPWNSLPVECFLLSYDLNGFKSRINRHLLTVGSFWTDFLYFMS